MVAHWFFLSHHPSAGFLLCTAAGQTRPNRPVAAQVIRFRFLLAGGRCRVRETTSGGAPHPSMTQNIDIVTVDPIVFVQQ